MKIGSLFSGYGGLDEGIRSVLGGDVAWVSDVEKGANKVLAYRYPDVPNLGDITKVDWTRVEPVDVICGGSPCQDVSHAGQRKGMTAGTRSNLWVSMREAIATIRPQLVVWENVGGAYSAAADSDLESREGRLGDGSGRPVLRALGRVLGDLASLGYVGGWHGLRAADVGAPHGRLRVFVVAVPATHADSRLHVTRSPRTDQRPVPGSDDPGPRPDRLLPSPRTSDTNGPGHHGDGGLDLRTAVTLMGTPTARMWKGSGPVGSDSHQWLLDHGNVEAQVLLLPTPAVNDMGRAYTPDEWDAWTEAQKAKHGNGNGHGKSLEIEAQRLLPTPNAGDAKQGYVTREQHDARARAKKAANPKLGGLHEDLALVAQTTQEWGDYAAAIARWERVLRRPAPAPTELGAKGNPRLSPAFTEWMMGLPPGWITDVPGVTRNEALKLCGNGVVPQQAAHAVRFLLDVVGVEGAAA